MHLEGMPRLSAHNRWVFVVGRITIESVDMDAKLRELLATLTKQKDARMAILDMRQSWTATLSDCRNLVTQLTSDADAQKAIDAVLDAAADAWDRRNRYVHDLLVDAIHLDDSRSPVVLGRRRPDQRLRVRLSRDKKGGAPDSEVVSLIDAVELVHQLVAVTWRLRAARRYLTGSTTWNGLLFGHVTGHWDGSASWVSDGDDDD